MSFSLPLIFFGGLVYLAQPLAAGAWEHPEQFFVLAGEYLPYIFGGGFSLFAWAQYNRLRFGGGRDKRGGAAPPLSLEEIAAASPFRIDELCRLREAKEVRFFFDEYGEVVEFQRWEEE
ncbi:MAG: PgaD family protein [Candidatus Adiutrix sp.]|nr:PgaD family protein [Candidatus Adiutrix sp.]